MCDATEAEKRGWHREGSRSKEKSVREDAVGT
jgi:hypothetical protein